MVTWFGMVVFRESGSSIQDVVRDVAGEEAVGFGFVGGGQVAEVIFFEDSDRGGVGGGDVGVEGAGIGKITEFGEEEGECFGCEAFAPVVARDEVSDEVFFVAVEAVDGADNVGVVDQDARDDDGGGVVLGWVAQTCEDGVPGGEESFARAGFCAGHEVGGGV